MQKISLIIIIILTVISIPQFTNSSSESFSSRMESIIVNSEKGDEVIGIKIASLNKGDTLFEHKQDVPLNPASCTKLATTAAALKLLGPNYQFHTKFYTDVRPSGGSVGKLWVKGSGDPSIVIERLWRMARDLANAGLKRIEGDIIIDDYYFDGYTYPGYSDDSSRAYNSMVGAVSLNFNTITVVVSPTSRVGDPPHIAPDTAGPYFRIINTARTGPRGSKLTLNVARSRDNEDDVITISGDIPIQAPPQYISRNISNPPLYFGMALKSLLIQNGIAVGGGVVRGLTPGGGYLLLDSVSKPLSLIIRDMNKYSNNFIAEQLVKTLAAEIGGAPGTTAKGIKVIQNYLSYLGIPADSYTLTNGSGLTTMNRMSASTLLTIMATLFADFQISPEAISSLSTAGIDGTIEKRYTSERLKGVVRAKTGSLNAVSSLVGTIPTTSGEILGYAIIMNGNALGWEDSNGVQDNMLNAMAAFAR